MGECSIYAAYIEHIYSIDTGYTKRGAASMLK
jgi:hypothetical protein